MRSLLLFIYLSAVPAWAELSYVEFTILNHNYKGLHKTYQIVLNDETGEGEVVEFVGMGILDRVYQGKITSVELPADARIDLVVGQAVKKAGFITRGTYSLENDKTSVGLRVHAESRLVLVTLDGAIQVPWPGQVKDVVQLARDREAHSGLHFYLFAVSGIYANGVYLVINGDVDHPIRLTDFFRGGDMDARIENGLIHIGALKKTIDPVAAQAAVKRFEEGRQMAMMVARKKEEERKRASLAGWFKSPGKAETLNELINLVDDRELFESVKDKRITAAKAVRGILEGQFPRLEGLESSDPELRRVAGVLAGALAELWISSASMNGKLIERVLVQRLEALVPDRAKCELSLMSFHGTGAHALSYYRGEALRAMNLLQRKLNKNIK